MVWSPRVTVAAVITDGAGRHLLVEEAPEGALVFNQPAGHLEPGESLLQAVCREVREETCREFTPLALLGVYQWVSPRGETYLRFGFHGRVGDVLDGCRPDPDIIRTHWVDPAEITNGGLPLRSPLVAQGIRDHLAGHHLPLEALHEMV
jgi:8-oxo-dGTP pyrophosphatase MutT (NUDIX family)